MKTNEKSQDAYYAILNTLAKMNKSEDLEDLWDLQDDLELQINQFINALISMREWCKGD